MSTYTPSSRMNGSRSGVNYTLVPITVTMHDCTIFYRSCPTLELPSALRQPHRQHPRQLWHRHRPSALPGTGAQLLTPVHK
jgi:hypothetical protein